ncbi:MAG: type II toxin-antitoxin system RelE/ParE family toxin [Minwuia sp.]|nr:type II toxin-antitoxin system RelE/ParE family toxin [Minwuia sp.]
MAKQYTITLRDYTSSVTVSVEARRDVKEIGRFTQQQWGKDQRNTYLRKIASVVEGLAADTSGARKSDDIRPGLLSVQTGSHVIFFHRRDDGDVVVLRILHQRMDFRRHL